MIDRLAVVSLVAMYAFFPLYGTFAAFAPHPPTAPLVGRPVVVGIAAVLALGMIGVAIGALRRRAQVPAWPLWLWANVAATYLGALLGFDPAVGVGLATVIAGMAAAHFTLLAYYRRPGVARAVYLAVLISGLLASVTALAFVALKHPADLYAFNHGRAVGTFLNPNELAEYLLAYLGVAAGLAGVARGRAVGRFAAVCTGVGALTLALTFSRWGLVAAATGVGTYTVALGRRRMLRLWPAAVLLGLALAVNVGFDAVHHEPQDIGARDVAWHAGISTWLHFPLTGVGPLAFERLYPVLRAPDAPGARTPVAFDPHDLPLSIAAETGTLGLIAFLVTLTAFARRLPPLAARAAPPARQLAYAIFAGVVAVEVHMLLNSASIAFGLIIQFSALALAAAAWGFERSAL